MKIFKFGGASVKDSDGVKNLVKILNYLGQQQTLIVISAMGKTTNSLELLVKNYFDNKDDLQYSLNEVFNFHNKILDDLFKEDNHQIFSDVKEVFENLRGFLKRNKSPDYSFVYDQVVSFGEILSTKIINSYLNYSNIRCNWVDARVLIKTDSKYRDANLNWEITKASISKNIDTKLLNITQGFIGCTSENFTTTLGREGSDFTAAILSYVLETEEVVIWKDVDGMLNADPRFFDDAQLLNQLSFSEAIELAYFGAKILHPQSIRPAKDANIPVKLLNTLKPEAKGTPPYKVETSFLFLV